MSEPFDERSPCADSAAASEGGGVSEVRHATNLKDQDDLDLAYWAWTIIANVSQGRWEDQTAEWRAAAEKWRDAFHAALDAVRNDGRTDDA